MEAAAGDGAWPEIEAGEPAGPGATRAVAAAGAGALRAAAVLSDAEGFEPPGGCGTCWR